MVEGFNGQQCTNYLVDGFPRNENNKTGWEATMTDKTNILQVLVIDCPENVSILSFPYPSVSIFDFFCSVDVR